MSAVECIAKYIQTKDFASLQGLGDDYQVEHLTTGWDKGRLRFDQVRLLIYKMSGGRETLNALTKKLGIKPLSARYDILLPKSSRSYEIEGLRDYLVIHPTLPGGHPNTFNTLPLQPYSTPFTQDR
jgi:hypothetical protein